MSPQRVLVISIDGVAPRFVTPDSMPHLCALAHQGASCFQATTVYPSITLPAHTSLLRGIDPSVHGILDNTPLPLSDDWPSFLLAARKAGLTTTALLNWSQVNGLVEADALDVRHFLNGGYGADDDRQIAAAAGPLLAERPDVSFAYLVSPDLAGHDHGWGSPEYYEAIAKSDRALGSLVQSAGEDAAIIVTTDHGGHDRDHQQSQPLDMQTFIVVRANGIAPATMWKQASILDVAPTVATIAGFDAPTVWAGSSLVGNEQPITDYLLGLLELMRSHSYGESVSMLEHSLQSAAVAADAGEPDELVAAALLHDTGHLLGDAGEWGLPDHAQVGAQALQQWFPPAVVEPIRLHVDAKRYLVTTSHEYHQRLSTASQQSLLEQGGPFGPEQAAIFGATPWAEPAITLRRIDDLGKDVARQVAPAEHYRPLLDRLTLAVAPSARSSRDQCACPTCRDATSGQHLIDIADLDDPCEHQHTASSTHPAPTVSSHLPLTLWSASRATDLRMTARDAASDPTSFAQQLSSYGIALATGLAPEPASVLRFAERIGFVRETNYGRLFDVQAVPDPNNLAYTALALPLHTDNPYRDPLPTVQILHCLEPTAVGGASLFSDGFRAAQELRTSHPEHFETLTTTPLDFHFRDETTDLRARHPMIALSVDGSVKAIHLNHRSMVTPPSGPTTEDFYDAYSTFAELLRSSDHMIEVDLAAGDVVAFDNRRVLHARTSFPAAASRHLQGCYIDMDAVHSMARRGQAQSTAVI